MKDHVDNAADLIGRVMIGLIFLWSGWGKIASYAGTVGYMEKFAISGSLLPIVISVEILGGFAILFGYKLKYSAPALAIFCLASAFIFHSNLGDRNQVVHLFKNIAIAGGLLVLYSKRPSAWSIDGRANAIRTSGLSSAPGR
jgi:putative oxidoreductase